VFETKMQHISSSSSKGKSHGNLGDFHLQGVYGNLRHVFNRKGY
jgi:hypothetical protein